MSRITRKPWCRGASNLANETTDNIILFDSVGTPVFCNFIEVSEHLSAGTGVWAVQLGTSRYSGERASVGDHLDVTVSALETSGLYGGIAKAGETITLELSDSLSVSSIDIINTTGAAGSFIINYGQSKIDTGFRSNQQPEGN